MYREKTIFHGSCYRVIMVIYRWRRAKSYWRSSLCVTAKAQLALFKSMQRGRYPSPCQSFDRDCNYLTLWTEDRSKQCLLEIIQVLLSVPLSKLSGKSIDSSFMIYIFPPFPSLVFFKIRAFSWAYSKKMHVFFFEQQRKIYYYKRKRGYKRGEQKKKQHHNRRDTSQRGWHPSLIPCNKMELILGYKRKCLFSRRGSN